MILKINYFMRIEPAYGQLNMLITTCVVDIIPFTIYMFIWILGMSIIYKILGISSTGYQGIPDNSIINFFLQVWENSIGNIGNPEFVTNIVESQTMIVLVYITWFIN